MADEQLPTAAERWLATASAALRATPERQRTEILDGLRAHISDALQSGDNLDHVLPALGDPSAVSIEGGSGTDDGTRAVSPYWSPRRWIQLTAFLAAVAGAVIVASLPSYVSSTIDTSGNLVNTQTHVALFSMAWQVAWSLGLAVLLTVPPLTLRGAAWRAVSLASAVALALLAVAAIIFAGNWITVVPAVLSIVALAAPATSRGRSRRIALA